MFEKIKKLLFKKMAGRDYLLYSLIIAGGVLLDLLTKRIAEIHLLGRGRVEWIPGFLRMTYAENDGIAFGMLGGGGLGRVLFMTVSLLMIGAVGLYLFLGHAEHRGIGVSLSLICAGGIGNMIERVGKGYVVDFIDVLLYYPDFRNGGWASYDFPIFNGADSFVCVGAGLLFVLLLIDIFKESKKNGAQGKKQPQDKQDEKSDGQDHTP